MYDIIIIGGGMAGASAAVFAGRQSCKTLLIDKGPDFGIVANIMKLNDMPGFDNSISPRDFLLKIKNEAKSLGVEIVDTLATSCQLGEPVKKITTNEPKTYEAKAVIITTGNMPHGDSHSYPGEADFRGRGVSHDSEIDAPSCKGSCVAIVGKSASSAESALKLSSFAERVYWVIPASKLEIANELKDAVERNPKIAIMFSSSLKKINGNTEVTSVTVFSAGQEKTFTVKYVFLPQQHYKPVTDHLNGNGIQFGSEGTIMVSNLLETNLKGVFAAGNILCPKPQFSVVCAAQGAIAGSNAVKFVKS